MKKKSRIQTNALGRPVPSEVNGRVQIPFGGVGKHEPQGAKHGPPIRSSAGYPVSGDKRVESLEVSATAW